MQLFQGFGSGVINTIYDYFYQPGAYEKTENPNISMDSIWNDVAIPFTELKEYSIKGFDCFKNNSDFNDFWKRANTCDASIVNIYSMLTHFEDDPKVKNSCQSLIEMLKVNLEFYKNTPHENKWVDDFGWWGLMSLNAYGFLKKLGQHALADEYFKVARDSWCYLVKYGYDNDLTAKPVPHGCRNNTADAQEKGTQSQYTKNTVVNALLLLLSTRLYKVSEQVGESLLDRKTYIDVAYRQWLWFSKWFERDDKVYLKTVKDDAALVPERPFLKDSDYQNTENPSWSEGWVWSADQALLIEGLSDIVELNKCLPEPIQEHNAIEYIKKIAWGIKLALIGVNDNIFHEAACEKNYTDHANDYIGGRGILVRYLNIQRVQQLTEIDFSRSILHTAKAIWTTRDSATNQFALDYATPQQSQEFFAQYKKLMNNDDKINGWSIDSTDMKFRFAAPQAVGLDFLGAAFRCNRL